MRNHFHPRRTGLLLRLRLAALLVLAIFAGTLAPAGAAELVMFERTGCIWCARWDRDVGAVYPLTEEGKKAPLRRVNIDRGVPPEFRLMPPVFYSPTFVLLENGKERGRITGYLGDDAFWGLLTRMVKEIGP